VETRGLNSSLRSYPANTYKSPANRKWRENAPVREASTIIQILCFAGLGLAWIAPMMPLIKWMERPDPGT
jgi:hypothetical protein